MTSERIWAVFCTLADAALMNLWGKIFNFTVFTVIYLQSSTFLVEQSTCISTTAIATTIAPLQASLTLCTESDHRLYGKVGDPWNPWHSFLTPRWWPLRICWKHLPLALCSFLWSTSAMAWHVHERSLWLSCAINFPCLLETTLSGTEQRLYIVIYLFVSPAVSGFWPIFWVLGMSSAFTALPRIASDTSL